MSVIAPNLEPDYFAATFARPPAWDTPTITVAPYVLAGDEILIRELRSGAADGPADLAGDTHFRYDGTITLDAVTASPTNFVVAPLLTGGASQNARYQTRIQTVTSVTKRIKFRFRAGGTQARFRISVGEPKAGIRGVRWVSKALPTFTGITAGSSYMVQLDFPVAASRLIQYEDSGGTGFGGAAVPSNVTLTRPVEPLNPLKVAFLGDSYSGGAANPPLGAGRMETSPNFIAKLLGATNWINYGIGGTGYIASPGTTFITRCADIVAYAPDIVIILGSRNDGNDAALSAAVASVMNALVSVPTVLVSGPSTAAYVVGNGYVKDAVLAANRTYLDGLATPWITTNDLFFEGDPASQIHPTFAGHQKIARGLYSAYKSIDTPVPIPPVVPTVGDTFNRADTAAGLGTSSLGQTWNTVGTGTSGIDTNAGYVYGPSTTVIFRTVSVGQAVGKYRLVIKTAGAAKNARAAFGYGGVDHNRIGGNGTNWMLERRVTGFSTINTDLGVAFASGDVCEWTWASDATLTITINGTQVFSAVVTENFTRTSMGLLGNSTTTDCRYDELLYTP